MTRSLASAVILIVPTPILAVIAISDLRCHLIRNRHVAAAAAAAVTAILGAGVADHRMLVRAAAGGALLAATPLAVASLARPANLGGGDVKLAAVVGGLVGAIHPCLALAVLTSALIATLFAIRLTGRENAPLAPAFVIVAAAALVVHVAVAW